MQAFSVFKLLLVLLSLTEIRMSSAVFQAPPISLRPTSGESDAFKVASMNMMTWKDAVDFCSQVQHGSFRLPGIPDYTGRQSDIVSIMNTYIVASSLLPIWFRCHLLQNTSLNSGNITCLHGSGSVIYDRRNISISNLDGQERIQNNNTCLAYNTAGAKEFKLRNCSTYGMVVCISDKSSNGSQVTISSQGTTSSTIQESSEEVTSVSSVETTTKLPSSSWFTTSFLVSDVTNPDSKSSTDDQGSTEEVSSEMSSAAAKTSSESTQSATSPLISGPSSSSSTGSNKNGHDDDNGVFVEESTSIEIVTGTSTSLMATSEDPSTIQHGSEDPLSSTMSLRVGPPNLVSTTFKRNNSQKKGKCSPGDSFPVRSALQCASACVGATDHACQGYDLNLDSNGGLECVLSYGSGNGRSNCNFIMDTSSKGKNKYN